jgi:hypothetical protein
VLRGVPFILGWNDGATSFLNLCFSIVWKNIAAVFWKYERPMIVTSLGVFLCLAGRFS